MRRIRQLLALHFGAGASSRAIGAELGIAPNTVREYRTRAAAARVAWPLGVGEAGREELRRIFERVGALPSA